MSPRRVVCLIALLIGLLIALIIVSVAISKAESNGVTFLKVIVMFILLIILTARAIYMYKKIFRHTR